MFFENAVEWLIIATTFIVAICGFILSIILLLQLFITLINKGVELQVANSSFEKLREILSGNRQIIEVLDHYHPDWKEEVG